MEGVRGRYSRLMKTLLILSLAVLTSCARTVAYHPNGKPALRVEADVTDLKFDTHADGSFELSGNFNHSAATTAQGNAAAGKLTAAGSAIAAAGAAVLIR